MTSHESEVIITSDGGGLSWNLCVWDSSTGAAIKSLKGGLSAPRTAALIGQQYIISAQIDKPLLHVWTTHGKEQLHMKMVCPGRVCALDVTPDGLYCIAAVAEKLHIWRISTGSLLVILSRHYQPITCIKTTDDGSFFVSAAQDSLVLIWSLASVLSPEKTVTVNPMHVCSQHSLPVTDIHIGLGGVRARLVTCSLDQTCKLFSLLSGQLLLSVTFDVTLTAVAMDVAETRIFAGGTNGTIYTVHLSNPPRQVELPLGEEEQQDVFRGHSKRITSLSLSLDGSHLLSGSTDGTARIWHVPSYQCIRVIQHKGVVTNAFYAPAYENFHLHESVKLTMPIEQFQRSTFVKSSKQSAVDDGSDPLKTVKTLLVHRHKSKDRCRSPGIEEYLKEARPSKVRNIERDWREEASKLKAINRHLYEFAVQNLLGDEDIVEEGRRSPV